VTSRCGGGVGWSATTATGPAFRGQRAKVRPGPDARLPGLPQGPCAAAGVGRARRPGLGPYQAP